MKTNKPDNRDDALRNVLKEWRAEAALPPRFQEGVWQHIERERVQMQTAPSAWAAVAHWISALLPRPAMAAAYVAALIFAGATVGWTQAHQTNARVKNELGERYVQVLDPYQAPRR
jgi:hypothetical protein